MALTEADGTIEIQERALLEEIVENLDEDAPRLIDADWLEDRWTEVGSKSSAESFCEGIMPQVSCSRPLALRKYAVRIPRGTSHARCLLIHRHARPVARHVGYSALRRGEGRPGSRPDS